MTKEQIRNLYHAQKMSEVQAEQWLALFGMSKMDADIFINPPF